MESLPVHSFDEVFPLCWRDLAHGVVKTRPSETAAMKTALTEPYASAVPYKEFDARVASIAKYVSVAVGGRFA